MTTLGLYKSENIIINPQYYRNVKSNDILSNNLFLGCTPITSIGLCSLLSILYNNLAIIANEIENMSFAYSQGNFQYLFTNFISHFIYL